MRPQTKKLQSLLFIAVPQSLMFLYTALILLLYLVFNNHQTSAHRFSLPFLIIFFAITVSGFLVKIYAVFKGKEFLVRYQFGLVLLYGANLLYTTISGHGVIPKSYSNISPTSLSGPLLLLILAETVIFVLILLQKKKLKEKSRLLSKMCSIGLIFFALLFVLAWLNFPKKNTSNLFYTNSFGIYTQGICGDMNYEPCLYKNKQIDHLSFQVFEGSSSYGSDAKNIFLRSCDGSCNFLPLKNVEKDSFEIIHQAWAKDRNQVFYHGQVISLDPENFRIIRLPLAQDSKNLYYEHRLIVGLAPNQIIEYDVESRTLKTINGTCEIAANGLGITCDFDDSIKLVYQDINNYLDTVVE